MIGAEQPTDGLVRFGLFGGVRIVRDGVEIEVSQPKQRAILALLLATPGQPVSLSEMIDALWAGEPAASVINQIHRHVGSLRRTCQPELLRRQVGRYIVAAGTGYRLVVDVEDCDVLRFRALAGEGRRLAVNGQRKEALRTYLDSLSVAAGPAGDDRLRALPAFVGLEDERIQTIIAAVELCDTPDDFLAALPVLRAASARHRLNEALHAQLITALTRTGRPAEALEIFAEIRAALREDVGTSPSHALQEAQARALRGDELPVPAPKGPGANNSTAVRPAQLPSPAPTFTGRRDVLSVLREGVEGRSRPLVVTGMAGVGKSTVALHYAVEVAEEYLDGQLYVNLRGFDATAPPVAPLDALRDMIEGLGVPAHSMPSSVDARSGLLRSLLSEKRVLLVLDNAHDYQQVEPLLPGDGESRVIITSRNQMPGLAAFRHARTIRVEPFTDDEAVEFLSKRLASKRSSDLDAMVRLGRVCGGLPLALAIVAARAAANPAFPLDLLVREFTQEQDTLTSLNAGSAELDLSTVFSWSHRALSEDAVSTFALLSAHPGPEISSAASVSISALGPRRTHEVLTELTLASVLSETRPSRFAFHDLVRAYALSLLDDRASQASARLIAHYVRSTRQAILSFGQAPVTPVDDTLPGVVPETFASSRDATRWYTEERQVLHEVCRLAVDMGDHRSALMMMLDWRPMSQAVDARHDMLPFADLATGAAEHVDEPVLRAEALLDAGSNLAQTGQPERARTYLDRAAATYEQIGDRLGQANVYRSLALTVVTNADERIKLLRESVTIAREVGDQPILATSLQALGVGLLWTGRFKDALNAYAECASISATMPSLAYLESHALSGRARALAGVGRLDDSASEASRALELFRREGEQGGELRLLRIHGDTLTALGRTQEAAESWRRFLALAASPELVQETNYIDDDTPGSVTIDRVRAKLAHLASRPG